MRMMRSIWQGCHAHYSALEKVVGSGADVQEMAAVSIEFVSYGMSPCELSRDWWSGKTEM